MADFIHYNRTVQKKNNLFEYIMRRQIILTVLIALNKVRRNRMLFFNRSHYG